MDKTLRITQFGDPILRLTAARLTDEQIKSESVQTLIQSMYMKLAAGKQGVGIAAPQVGLSLAISVIHTKPTPTRPELIPQKLTIINPEIVMTHGEKTEEWEACLSGTRLYAQVPRFKKIRLRWQDESSQLHERDFTGFIAHVIQHEVDHLNGVLFVDKVKNTKSYMTYGEYKKMKRKSN